jgi:putative ABC transport system substrate-binding protein
MHVVGVLAFAEHVLADVTEFRLALDRQGYFVHLEQMGYDLHSKQIGYFEEGGLLLWLGRCYGNRGRCFEIAERYVEADVDVILAMTTPAVEVALSASDGAGIPVVFTHVTDPMAEGLVSDLVRPGGRVTGVRNMWMETLEERLALIQQAVPTPTTIHAFYNPSLPTADAESMALHCAADELGLELVLHEASDGDEIKRALASLRTSPDHAIFRLSDPTTAPMTGLLGAVAHEQYIPYIGLTLDELEQCGALFALDQRGIGSQAAILVERILKGADPATIPVAEPEKRVLGVNLQAAQDLGLVVSPTLLEQAQLVIPARERTFLGARLLLILVLTSLFLNLVQVIAARYGFLYSMAMALAATLVLAFSLWFYINRHIIHPIRELTIVAEKIGAGDLDVKMGEVKVEDEIGVLARAFRRMRSNLKKSYAELGKLANSLEQRVEERTAAYRALQQIQRELELANRRIIEADDSARFALTTYIHDEILGLLDELTAKACDLDNATIANLVSEVEQRMRRLRFDLSAPIIQDMRVELRRLIQETLPQIYPVARQVRLSLNLSAFDQVLEMEPSHSFLLYRFTSGAVSNVYRHARASHIMVEAATDDGQLVLRVADDGRGFDPAKIECFVRDGHYFFHDISIRVRQLGGTFRVDSKSGAGTTLEIAVPVQRNDEHNNLELARDRGNTAHRR